MINLDTLDVYVLHKCYIHDTNAIIAGYALYRIEVLMYSNTPAYTEMVERMRVVCDILYNSLPKELQWLHEYTRSTGR